MLVVLAVMLGVMAVMLVGGGSDAGSGGIDVSTGSDVSRRWQ